MNESKITEKKLRSNLFFLLIPFLFVIAYLSSHSLNSTPFTSKSLASADELQISIENEYNVLYGQTGMQYPWIDSIVVEPYRKTNLQVLNPSDSPEFDYVWTIKGQSESAGVEESFTGQIISFVFKELKYLTITVKEISTIDKTVIRSTSQTVICRYVRREIRTLTDGDRMTFFDAIETLMTLPSSEGKELHGSKYNDMNFFVELHNNRAGDSVCDHMHDGYGFIPSHAALTLAFEQSLQTLNPSITVPYWDYTIDTENMKNENGDVYDWYNSIVFNDDWFGEANPSGKVVTNGRFSYIPIRKHMFNSSSVHNAYGFLRAPWNQNKIPYVTRSSGIYGFKVYDLPSCDHHYDLLHLNKFQTFAASVPYAPHGAIHIALGGIWGADWVSYLEKWGFNMTDAKSWGDVAFAKQKNLFRMRTLHCPNFCSFDSPNEDCTCYCPDYDKIINDEAALKNIIYLTFGSDIDPKFYVGLFNLLCNTYDDLVPRTGDQLESASPADPSFWPIHPTIDRLFQWKRINGFEEMHWVDNRAWSVHGYDLGYCKGHNIDDIIGFGDLFAGSAGPYTNRDLLQLMNPEDGLSPYIYDNFYWSHCSSYPSDLMGS